MSFKFEINALKIRRRHYIDDMIQQVAAHDMERMKRGMTWGGKRHGFWLEYPDSGQ